MTHFFQVKIFILTGQRCSLKSNMFISLEQSCEIHACNRGEVAHQPLLPAQLLWLSGPGSISHLAFQHTMHSKFYCGCCFNLEGRGITGEGQSSKFCRCLNALCKWSIPLAFGAILGSKRNMISSLPHCSHCPDGPEGEGRGHLHCISRCLQN